MTALRLAAQQALEFCESVHGGCTDSDDGTVEAITVWCPELIEALRAALKQEKEASAWLDERKEYWRKEKEKMQATNDQDPELSAALGWPGGTSDPVLDRTRLLQMVAALRVASKQALDWLYENDILHPTKVSEALRAALAQQAEPVEPVGEVVAIDFSEEIGPEAIVMLHQDVELGEMLYAAPPQRKLVPLTEDEIDHATKHCGVSRYTAINITRAVEKASWEKNNE
jgi:hypothetical protein